MKTKLIVQKHLFQGTSWIEEIASIAHHFALVTDSHLSAIAESLKTKIESKGLTVDLFVLPPGEANKTRACKEQLENQLCQAGIDKASALIALGGGMVSDLAGFVAATYCRGIRWIIISTTLVSMVDAALGGKVGVNTPWGKNLIGAFYPAQLVFIDPDHLITLPMVEMRNGLAEIIKYALIASKPLFATLGGNKSLWDSRDSDFLLELIQTSLAIKQKVLRQDPYEKAMRRILNFGHTLGHAIESASGYRISHGHAIAIGMKIEAHVSHTLQYLSNDQFEAIDELMNHYGWECDQLDLPLDQLTRFMRSDKKALSQKIRLVLLESIGKTHDFSGQYCREVPEKIIKHSIERMVGRVTA